RIAGVEGKHDIGRDLRVVIDNRGTLEAGPGKAKLRTLLIVFADQRLVHIDADQASRDVEHSVEIVVSCEGEIGRAAAAVENLHRPVRQTIQFARVFKQL